MPETAKASTTSAHSSVTILPHHRRAAKNDMNDAARTALPVTDLRASYECAR